MFPREFYQIYELKLIQVKIFKPRLILNFLFLQALIVYGLGLRDKGNWELTLVKKF